MTRGVFLHRADSIYDDVPDRQYQFPKQYLSRASQFVGDWIVYYEPTKARGGRIARGYYALAQVQQIVPDPQLEGMHLALIQRGSYLEFPKTVPFKDVDGIVERGLLNDLGNLSGRAQAAVRALSLEDFNRILQRALEEEQPTLPRFGDPVAPALDRLMDEQSPFEVQRDRVLQLTARPVRDRIFRRLVLQAYDCRCAITGGRFINGGGRAEAQAAHIRPVEANGPDSIHNGIALSGTVHWMFDRGLIALGDDYEILISRQVNDTARVQSMVNPSGRAFLPASPSMWPQRRFLRWHREHCFKQ